MNLQLIILRIYFKFISFFSSRAAALLAFKLFQKVRIKSIKDKAKTIMETNRKMILLKNININNNSNDKPVNNLCFNSLFNYIPPKFLFIL